ncbi:unnamed protein product [Nezara viridula]|uniref:Uncharacterized protein n=1 Tax=Nezara viridula TaxID=85310 RepID=A0A9P0HSI0_NEZVI|nr:unnamed protein product [Nezara viridula]
MAVTVFLEPRREGKRPAQEYKDIILCSRRQESGVLGQQVDRMSPLRKKTFLFHDIQKILKGTGLERLPVNCVLLPPIQISVDSI